MLALNIAIIGKVFADLADVRRWLAWRTETRSGRTTKVLMIGSQGPIKHASSTDPRTWHDLATVRAALANGHRLDGPGIVLGQLEDGRWLVGVDLDPCRSPPSGEVVGLSQADHDAARHLCRGVAIRPGKRPRTVAVCDCGSGRSGLSPARGG